MNPTNAKAEQQCDSAIGFVTADIETRIGGKITSVGRSEAANSPFQDAKEEIIIELDANMSRGTPLKYRRASPAQVSANENIVNSKSLSLSYADKIIRSCQGVARLGLGLYENRPYYSLHDNNQIIPDTCGSNQVWGQQICE